MHKQAGGTILGLILGILIGLAGALAVAVYVTKVPVPFVDRGVSGTPGQDAAEAKKNKNWDPNALFGGNARPTDLTQLEPVAVPQLPPGLVGGDAPLSAPAVSSDPLGDLAQAKLAGDALSPSGAGAAPATEPAAEPAPLVAAAVKGGAKMDFYVQAGAFATVDEAESQRARLAIMGIDVRVSTTQRDGATLHRVRSGPYRDRDEASAVRKRLTQAGVANSLVAVRRP
jgi:cell division protein FtsN